MDLISDKSTPPLNWPFPTWLGKPLSKPIISPFKVLGPVQPIAPEAWL